MSSSRPEDWIVHLNPVWRERANFIISAVLDADAPRRYEQLWARDLGDHTFELCCIPFCTYGLALGDVVTTASAGDLEYAVQRVTRPSGRFAFRASLAALETTAARDRAMTELEALDGLLEWYSGTLAAIDASSEAQASSIRARLEALEQRGVLAYETGWR